MSACVSNAGVWSVTDGRGGGAGKGGFRREKRVIKLAGHSHWNDVHLQLVLALQHAILNVLGQVLLAIFGLLDVYAALSTQALRGSHAHIQPFLSNMFL